MSVFMWGAIFKKKHENVVIELLYIISIFEQHRNHKKISPPNVSVLCLFPT